MDINHIESSSSRQDFNSQLVLCRLKSGVGNALATSNALDCALRGEQTRKSITPTKTFFPKNLDMTIQNLKQHFYKKDTSEIKIQN